MPPATVSNGVTQILTVLSNNNPHHQIASITVSVCRVIGQQIVLMPGMSGHPITQLTNDQAQEFREQFERFRCREHFQSAQTTPMTEICSNLIFSSSSSVYDGAQGQQWPDVCIHSEAKTVTKTMISM